MNRVAEEMTWIYISLNAQTRFIDSGSGPTVEIRSNLSVPLKMVSFLGHKLAIVSLFTRNIAIFAGLSFCLCGWRSLLDPDISPHDLDVDQVFGVCVLFIDRRSSHNTHTRSSVIRILILLLWTCLVQHISGYWLIRCGVCLDWNHF